MMNDFLILMIFFFTNYLFENSIYNSNLVHPGKFIFEVGTQRAKSNGSGEKQQWGTGRGGFVTDRPEKCSGLPIQQYSEQLLSELFCTYFSARPSVHT
jgi:hypothetical protein